MSPDQRGLTARGRGKELSDGSIKASKQAERLLFLKSHGHISYSVPTYQAIYLSIYQSINLSIHLFFTLCNAKIEEKHKICSRLFERVSEKGSHGPPWSFWVAFQAEELGNDKPSTSLSYSIIKH